MVASMMLAGIFTMRLVDIVMGCHGQGMSHGVPELRLTPQLTTLQGASC